MLFVAALLLAAADTDTQQCADSASDAADASSDEAGGCGCSRILLAGIIRWLRHSPKSWRKRV